MQETYLLIDKPTGLTSFGVVARVRRKLTQKYGKKVKVGHTGTLDPFATGLMILLVGPECKNASHYSKLGKVYEATFTLGKTSSTGDSEGDITETSNIEPSKDEILEALHKFTGEISQQPPVFSAIKINGQRAYKLAREGQEVEMPKRQVTVYSLDLVEYNYPELKVRAEVSSGTYIRSLAKDIGEALKTGAYCSQLRRTRVGEHSIDQATTLNDFMDAPQ